MQLLGRNGGVVPEEGRASSMCSRLRCMLLEFAEVRLQVQCDIRGQLPFASLLRGRGLRGAAGCFISGAQLVAQSRGLPRRRAGSGLRVVRLRFGR